MHSLPWWLCGGLWILFLVQWKPVEGSDLRLTCCAFLKDKPGCSLEWKPGSLEEALATGHRKGGGGWAGVPVVELDRRGNRG